VIFNTVDDPDDVFVFVKPVGTPVLLNDSTIVIASVELDTFAEVFDSSDVLPLSNVVTSLSPFEETE